MSTDQSALRTEQLLAADVETHLICSPSGVALTAAYGTTGIELSANTAVDGTATPLPSGACFLVELAAALTSIAGGATALNWYISYDSAGLFPLTNAISSPILASPGTPTSGGTVAAVNIRFRRPFAVNTPIGTVGSLFVFVSTNAGTANGTFRLTYTGFAPYPRYQYIPSL